MAKKVDEKVTESREKFRRSLAHPALKRSFLLKNTTEGLNLVSNAMDLKKDDAVLTTDREHNSNLVPWQVQVHKRG